MYSVRAVYLCTEQQRLEHRIQMWLVFFNWNASGSEGASRQARHVTDTRDSTSTTRLETLSPLSTRLIPGRRRCRGSGATNSSLWNWIALTAESGNDNSGELKPWPLLQPTLRPIGRGPRAHWATKPNLRTCVDETSRCSSPPFHQMGPPETHAPASSFRRAERRRQDVHSGIAVDEGMILKRAFLPLDRLGAGKGTSLQTSCSRDGPILDALAIRVRLFGHRHIAHRCGKGRQTRGPDWPPYQPFLPRRRRAGRR